jgi:hypothetical protein
LNAFIPLKFCSFFLARKNEIHENTDKMWNELSPPSPHNEMKSEQKVFLEGSLASQSRYRQLKGLGHLDREVQPYQRQTFFRPETGYSKAVHVGSALSICKSHCLIKPKKSLT